MIDERLESEREKQFFLLEKFIQSQFAGKFSKEASKIIEGNFTEEMWVKLHDLQVSHMEILENRVKFILRGLGYSIDYIDQYIFQIRMQCYEVLKSKIEKYSQSVVDHLSKRFNQLFFKDDRGIPRD